MKKPILILLPALAFLAVSAPGNAQEFMSIGGQKDDITVKGTVAEVGTESFVLQTETARFLVQADDLDLNTSLANLLAIGSNVYVSGDIESSGGEHPTLDADQINVVGKAANTPVVVLGDREGE